VLLHFINTVYEPISLIHLLDISIIVVNIISHLGGAAYDPVSEKRNKILFVYYELDADTIDYLFVYLLLSYIKINFFE
jgi:hypothetical protein